MSRGRSSVRVSLQGTPKLSSYHKKHHLNIFPIHYNTLETSKKGALRFLA